MTIISNMSNGSTIFDNDFAGLASSSFNATLSFSWFNTTTVAIETTSTTKSPTTGLHGINLEMLKVAEMAINTVVTPCVSLIGLICNILSIILIYQDGARKSSNILLIALAVADTTFLMGATFQAFFNAFLSKLLPFSISLNYFIFVMFVVFRIFMLDIGFMCSNTFVNFITIERLIAVYFPLKFHTLVTPLRTLSAVAVAVVFYGSYMIFVCLSQQLNKPFTYKGNTFQIIGLSPIFYRYRKENDILYAIVNQLTGSVSMAVLIIGCLAIGYKVKKAALRRAQMMSQGQGQGEGAAKNAKSTSQKRTTKTLLAVCVTFVILAGLVFIYDLIIHHLTLSLRIKNFTRRLRVLIICINSSSNFFIYVFNNNKFKDNLAAMFSRKGNNPNSGKENMSTKS